MAIPDGQRVAGMDADSDPITAVMIEAWAGAYDQDGYLVDDAGAQVWEPIVFPQLRSITPASGPFRTGSGP